MTAPRLAVVLPTRNSRHLAISCLRSLIEKAGEPILPIVVDDASEDGTPDVVRGGGLGARVVVLEKRSGLAAALNRGFREAGELDVVRVDHDIEMLTDGWVAKLYESLAQNPSAGIVGVKSLSGERNVIDSCGWDGLTERGATCDVANVGRGQKDTGQFRGVFEVDAVIGACALYTRDAIREVGGMDEAYFPVYLEDIDFCMLARTKGFKVVVQANVAIRHWKNFKSGRLNQILGMDGEAHFELLNKHWQEKWGWHFRNPDLAAIKRRWSGTEVCWRINRTQSIGSTT